LRIPVGVFTALVVIGSLTACTTAPPVKTLADGGIGKITFESVTVTTQEFLRGRGSGTPVVITGALQLPQGASGRVPAVVLVHGSAGLAPTVRRWEDVLLQPGVATFVLESFSGRGIRETFTDQSRLSHFAMLADAYRAPALLATHPQIDPTRIGIMGFSNGGEVTLSAALSLSARYLFEARTIRRRQSTVVVGNLASKRVAEKCGVTSEGIARKAVFLRGKNMDLEWFALLREGAEQQLPPTCWRTATTSGPYKHC
jgi:pimeloyl-ACP methyl ester carboxylesterase